MNLNIDNDVFVLKLFLADENIIGIIVLLFIKKLQTATKEKFQRKITLLFSTIQLVLQTRITKTKHRTFLKKK